MIRRLLIIAGELTVLGVAVVTGVLFWASYYVDTEEFVQQFTHAVEQATGRSVQLRGELNIALYPTISLEVLDLAVDGDPDFSTAPLVEFDTLRVSARLMPLLSKRLELRTIVVEGMTVNVVRAKSGQLNWQTVLDRQENLASAEQSVDGGLVDVSLSGLEVVNATIAYQDDRDGDTFSLSGIDIRTGSIAPGQSVPFSADSRFAWKGGGVESKIILKGIIEMEEEAGLVKLKDTSVYASVGGDFLPVGANPGELTAKVRLDWKKKVIGLDNLQGRFLGIRTQGSLRSTRFDEEAGAVGEIRVQPFNPTEIIERYYPDAPIDAVDGLNTGAFKARFSINESGVALSDMSATLDDMQVDGSISMKGWRSPFFNFALQNDTVDLDRYLPLFRTDTPFVWGDFGLPFFSALRGKGTIKSKSFKVLDNALEDVSVVLRADSKGISGDGSAITPEGPMDATTNFHFGKKNGTGIPTLALDVIVNLRSFDAGFSFLRNDEIVVAGPGNLSAQLAVSRMDCPPEERSIGILRHASGKAALTVDAGRLQAGNDAEKGLKTAFDQLKSEVEFSPIDQKRDGYYGFRTAVSVRGTGLGRVRTLLASLQGPVVTAVDSLHVLTPGLQVRASANGRLYMKQNHRLVMNGRGSYDSKRDTLGLEDVSVRTLKTTVTGNARFTNLGENFKGNGRIDISGANVRHIVYLLNKFVIKTEDADALKSVDLTSSFDVDGNGFRVNELNGHLDGMPIKGHIVGQGLWNPKMIVSLSAGAFDLDRYLPPSSDNGNGNDRNAPVELPLKFLKLLRVNGKVWFEEFKLADLRAGNVSALVDADDGRIEITNLKGAMYQGAVTGDWVAKVSDDALTTQLQLHLEDAQAGLMLKDLAERDYVRGKTDLDFKLTSLGRTDEDILRNLNGKAWGRITDGSFKFTGYNSKASSNVRSANRDSGNKSDPKKRRTVFRKTVGYFTVKQGEFMVDKFRVEAPPLLQSYGSGRFSLPDNSIDLSVRNDFVAVPSVTIRIVGKLSDPEVEVPKDKILNDTVRNILSLPEKSFEFLRDLFK